MRATQLRNLYDLSGTVSDEQLQTLIAGHGLTVVRWPFVGRTVEALCGRVIGLRVGLTESQSRWWVSHALGHYLLHSGDHLKVTDMAVVDQQERQAESFAGWLHMAGANLALPAWELAEQYDLPEQCIARWLQMVCG